jgi:hypothetical protein
MTNLYCPNCKIVVKAGLMNCPKCEQHRAYLLELDGDEISPKVESVNKENASFVAIQSAKIVNAYGTYIQIFGIALGLVTIIGGIALANSGSSSAYGWIGLILGLIDIAICAVQGALVRMISNYVIARLEKD